MVYCAASASVTGFVANNQSDLRGKACDLMLLVSAKDGTADHELSQTEFPLRVYDMKSGFVGAKVSHTSI